MRASLFSAVFFLTICHSHGEEIPLDTVTGDKHLPDSLLLELPEARVKAPKHASQPTEVKREFLGKIPNTMNDPIRVVSFLPGVTVQSDLNVRPYVRGGNSDQTEVVVNGIAFLQPYHVGGVFSIFNANTIESLDLYREGFPVEYPGALSGVVKLKTKRPAESKTELKTNLSLLRGDLFTEVPLVKQRLSVYGAAQSFLLNRSLHGLLNLSSTFSKDSLYQQDIQTYRNHINLPDFEDYGWGAAFRVNDALQINYSGSLSTDRYTVVIPSQTKILVVKPGTGTSTVVIPVLPDKEIKRSKKLSVDSISSVNILNQTHFLNLPWDINSQHFVENNLAYQAQAWEVAFKKGAPTTEALSLYQSTRAFDYRLIDTYTPSNIHQFKYGISYGYKLQRYQARMPYVLYDIITNSNLDVLEGLGYYTDLGFRIPKEDSTKSNFDYLGDYTSRIRFTHVGGFEEHFGSLFFSHSLQTQSGVLVYGMRGEFQNTSQEFFPGPRLSYTWRINTANDLLFSSGVYSQNNLAYYVRDQNPQLKSEKSAQTGLQWTHRMGEGYRFEFQNYYKRYFDMISPTLAPNGNIQLGGILLPNPESKLSAEDIARLKAILDTTKNFKALPDSIQQVALPVFGDLIFNYANTGVGNSYGTEFSFFYNPSSAWRGWASLDLSISDRRDAPGEVFYPYRYHRPLVFNWVNYFDIPGNFDIGLTYRFALGQPYTPYSGTLDGTGSKLPILVGSRNSGRLAPYNRLDLRLARHSRLFNRNFKTYVEVWNSMNDPNYFARDSQTGELKSAQLNWPFPLLFLGISAEL